MPATDDAAPLLKRFHEQVQARHQYAQDWKARTGRKVLGYLCCYLPEEIAYAAGVLPVRVVSSHEPQDLSNLHVAGFFCPFSRDCMGEALKGKYDYVDGLAMGHCCLMISQTFDSWILNLPLSYNYYVPVPGRVDDPKLRPFLASELGAFKESLEKWTGKPITAEALDKAVDVYNTSRSLLKQIYDMRRADGPPIWGAEVMDIVLSTMFTDKAETNGWLSELVKALPSRQHRPRADAPRVMVVGGETHDSELIRLIEDQGALVVADDLCMGSRYFWNEVGPQGDRLSAIAQRYMDKPSCPVKDTSNNTRRVRFEFLKSLVHDYRVQGAILVYQKFCDPQELDVPVLKDFFKELGLPTTVLELDTTLAIGQVKTRAQAFVEMLELEVV
ncbi:MAG: 2-hydroxyacyl-CoA dehydratase [Chloroflexi bacterium]|nr:2-hydroxyacyl-CoA dehydratase [Chloroflexota bacterium]